LGAKLSIATEHPTALGFLSRNIAANRNQTVMAVACDWADKQALAECPDPDIVFATDCTYNDALHDIFIKTLISLLNRRTRCVAYVFTDEASTPNCVKTIKSFVALAKRRGLAIEELDPPNSAAKWRDCAADTVSLQKSSRRADRIFVNVMVPFS
jgi:predicted nicotinamide N-methyase